MMRRNLWLIVANRRGSRRRLLFGIVAAWVATGCHREAKIEIRSVSKPPIVQLLNPPERSIVRIVSQPSFIEAYERTSIYPKLTAYIKDWKVDIGDKVKKDQPLAYLFVPELEEDYETKKATVKLDEEGVELAKKVTEVAKADVQTAEARLKEAKAFFAQFQAEVIRWDSEVKRLKHEVDVGVVDPQVLLESQNQLRSSTAARDSANATIEKADADLLSAKATLAKAVVDVKVAEATLAVAQSEERRLKAWVGYLILPAPFDGVIVARNANTFDFVLPTTGDPSTMENAPHLSPGAAAPIYVVDRTDIVRIFVDIPEQDANYVQIGTKATVLAKAYRDQPIQATVTRTAWALNVKSRTLRAEIDLPNPNSQLLPGMYAYAKVIIERPGVRALPVTALTQVGDQSFCWMCDNGHAVRAEIQTGVSDDQWIEVTNHRLPASEADTTGMAPWSPFDGSERVILGDLSILSDGSPVEIAQAAAGMAAATAAPRPTTGPTDTASATSPGAR
jgi:HlyD family secretion protein